MLLLIVYSPHIMKVLWGQGSLYCSLMCSKHLVQGLAYATYSVNIYWVNEEGICSLQTFSSVQISGNLLRFRWARVQGWWQGRADKASWALVGGLVCSVGGRQDLAEPSLHLCKSKGFYHSLTLHVDTFWNVLRTRHLWQMPFCLTHADCLKWGNICQKLNAVLGTL